MQERALAAPPTAGALLVSTFSRRATATPAVGPTNGAAASLGDEEFKAAMRDDLGLPEHIRTAVLCGPRNRHCCTPVALRAVDQTQRTRVRK